METKTLIEALATNGSYHYETLARLSAYDAVLNCDYEFLAYKETERSGDWRVRIKSSQTAGAVFEPAMMRNKARETTAQGKSWFQWGYSFDPTPGVPRNIQIRVHVKDGQPSEIEMFVQLLQYGGAPADAQSVRFSWPES
jgi:hypothetical protein